MTDSTWGVVFEGKKSLDEILQKYSNIVKSLREWETKFPQESNHIMCENISRIDVHKIYFKQCYVEQVLPFLREYHQTCERYEKGWFEGDEQLENVETNLFILKGTLEGVSKTIGIIETDDIDLITKLIICFTDTHFFTALLKRK